MMMSANMWDVTREDGAVGILQPRRPRSLGHRLRRTGQVEGGMRRTLTDHVIVALSEAIDTVKEITGQNIHLAGYSQGGMFSYQAAATSSPGIWRASSDSAPRWTPWRRCRWGSAQSGAVAPVSWPITSSTASISRAGWPARLSQMLDPLKTAKARVDFVNRLHDRESLLPREQQRRFLDSEAGMRGPGPAVSELLKQFIAHNRLMSGGFAINGQLVTLTDITCPCWRSSARSTTSASRARCAASSAPAPSAEVCRRR